LKHPDYHSEPKSHLDGFQGKIASFMDGGHTNSDQPTIDSFSEEWTKFNSFSDDEIEHIGAEYFDIVTKEMLHKHAAVLDMGCGTGRWSRYIADRAGVVEAIDPGQSVFAASRLLADKNNVRITQASSDSIPFADETFDLVVCLGVLHHIPDTQKALNDLIAKLKPGGYALLYFYYNLENRGTLYKLLFRCSNAMRQVISKQPAGRKKILCDGIAWSIYLPLRTFASMIKILSGDKIYQKLPLSYYVGKSMHVMRNDALDRFGTPLEKRYSKQDITTMCNKSGLTDLHFSENTPYWHLIARKRLNSSRKN
jgi:SAM-dependent methyltransferase